MNGKPHIRWSDILRCYLCIGWHPVGRCRIGYGDSPRLAWLHWAERGWRAIA